MTENNTILLTVRNVNFLMKSDTPLDAKEREDIEFLCESAFYEESEFVEALGEGKTTDDLAELGTYELALLAQKVFRDRLGITARFQPIYTNARIIEC